MKRTAIALLASLGLHASLLAATLRFPFALALAPKVRVVPITLEDVRELPLRQPPRARKARAKDEASKPRRAPASSAAREARAPAKPATGTAAPEVTVTRRRGDLSAYGPEGSRLVAVLRLDRLRAAPDARARIAAVDDALRLLPDRRRLLDDTRLDLYRDFDSLLVATPDPLDDAATLLAARHRLGESALRAALGRGARAGGRTIEWRRQRGRWVGVRRVPGGASAPDRDERLFLLPAPGLLVIASPAYAKLLLDGAAAARGRAARGESTAERSGAADWAGLVARIDAEDGAVPEDAAFVASATDLLAPAGGPPAAAPAPAQGTENGVEPPPGRAMPREVSLIVGTNATSFLEIRAGFEREEDARAWEARCPEWKQQLAENPLVLLAHLDALVARTEIRLEERTLVLRAEVTGEEMLRLLRMIGSLASLADEGGAAGQARSSGAR